MKRLLIVGLVVLVLGAVVAVAAFAAPGGPGTGSGTTRDCQGHMGGAGMMQGFQGRWAVPVWASAR